MDGRPLFAGFDHVAWASRDTDATVGLLQALGFEVRVYKQPLDKFNVYVTKLMAASGHVAEVIEPRGPGSVVSRLLEHQEAAVYHVCFRTRDFRAAQAALQQAGAVTVTRPMRIPYPVTDEHATFWDSHVFHPGLGLFEIAGGEPAAEPAG